MAIPFEDVQIDPVRRELTRNSTRIEVEPRVFDLLLHLIENRDRVVSKDELIAHVWNGRIVSDSALTSAINAARHAVGDDGRTQGLIRTSARRGYRFVASLEQPAMPLLRSATTAESSGYHPAHFSTGRPAIAVLPFQNISGDPEQEYFADGIVEDIITALSRFKSLLVIAPNSSFSYKGGAVDIQQVARELGVRYVLEGSVRKASGRVRVTAQLIEAAMGVHVWAEKYDRALADTFELQDELTYRIVTHLQPEIAIAESERAKGKDENEFTAWDCYLRAADLIRTHDAANVERAEALLKTVVAIRRDFAPAYAKLSACRLKAHYMTSDRNEAALDEALQHAQRAIQLDPHEALGYDALASVLQRAGKMEASIANAKRAIELSPTLMAAHGTLISSLAFSGQALEAIEAYRVSERLSPRDLDRSQRLMGLMLAQFVAGNYEEAIRVADEHILLQPKWGNTRRWRAASLALLGKLDDARLAMAEYLKMEPYYTISVYNRIGLLQQVEDRKRLIEGFRLAGLPE